MPTLQQIFLLLLQYKYYLLLPIAIFEGPIITIIAAFLAAQGYLNVYLVFAVVVLGDVLGDMLYYAVGKYGGKKFINRFGRFFRVSEEKMAEFEKMFHTHRRKTLITGKMTHALGSIVLLAAGVAEIPFWEFVLYNFLPTLPKSLLLVIVGYFFGEAYAQIDKYITYGSYVIGGLIVVAAIVYLIYRKYYKKSKL